MIIVLIVLFVLFALGVPIAYTLGLTGVVAILTVGTIKMEIIPLTMFNGAQSYTLIAIPLFMLMGEIMNKSSISTRLIDFACALVGFVRGGLGMAAILTGTVMAAISGSAVADAAALGSILIPQMEKKGYGKPFATATVSAAATLASMIPPSINMILYAVIAGVSISQLFIAGVIPGLLIALLFMVVVWFFAKKVGVQADAKPNFGEIGRTFAKAFWGLLLPIVVVGGILGGFFTPTEAGAIGVVYALFLGAIVYREFSMQDFFASLIGATKQTAIVILMVSTSSLLGWYISQQMIPQQLAEFMLGISSSKYVVLAMSVIILLIAGMFLQASPLIVMLIPIVAPLVGSVGIDLVVFGVIACIALCIGQISPPVASVLMTTTGIAQIGMEKIILWILPMIGVMLLVLILVAVFPEVALWLPRVLNV